MSYMTLGALGARNTWINDTPQEARKFHLRKYAECATAKGSAAQTYILVGQAKDPCFTAADRIEETFIADELTAYFKRVGDSASAKIAQQDPRLVVNLWNHFSKSTSPFAPVKGGEVVPKAEWDRALKAANAKQVALISSTDPFAAKIKAARARLAPVVPPRMETPPAVPAALAKNLASLWSVSAQLGKGSQRQKELARSVNLSLRHINEALLGFKLRDISLVKRGLGWGKGLMFKGEVFDHLDTALIGVASFIPKLVQALDDDFGHAIKAWEDAEKQAALAAKKAAEEAEARAAAAARPKKRVLTGPGSRPAPEPTPEPEDEGILAALRRYMGWQEEERSRDSDSGWTGAASFEDEEPAPRPAALPQPKPATHSPKPALVPGALDNKQQYQMLLQAAEERPLGINPWAAAGILAGVGVFSFALFRFLGR